MTELLDTVEIGNAVIAFNFIGLDDLRGVMKAVEGEQVPVILQVSQGTAAHLGVGLCAAIARLQPMLPQFLFAYILTTTT